MPQFRESMGGNITQTARYYPYMDYLQERNKNTLFSILSGDDIDDTPLMLELEDDREGQRGREAVNRVVSQILTHTGISDILPLQQLGRLQGAIERAQSRFFQDIRMQMAQVSIPLERFANDVVFRYEAYISEHYAAAAVGSLIGSAIGFYYLGPIGGTIGEIAGGLAIPFIQDYIDWTFSLPTRSPRRDIPANWEDMSPAELEEAIWGTGGTTDTNGGLPDIIYNRAFPIRARPSRHVPILDMESNLYRRI